MNTITTSDRKVKLRGGACCGVFELRQYALHPGKRDTLIELFEREFIETQETAGIQLIGQFRDLDDPDSFVWLRGFADMPARKRALQAFYEGPAWKKHREAANATMLDSGNVLLLRSARSTSGFSPERGASRRTSHGLLLATIYYIDDAPQEFIDFFEQSLEPACREAGSDCLAYFVTEHSANNYPALPVREGEQVFVWFASFASELAKARYEEALQSSHPAVVHALSQRLRGRPDRLRLAPTARSRLQV